MSDTSTGDPEKPTEQPNNDLSEVMGQLSVISNKTSSSLSDMPVDIVSLIIERCEYIEQLLLRKVSKSLRALVDSQKPACKLIDIECDMDQIHITFSDQHVMYANRFYDNAFGETLVISDNFKKVAFDDLASNLKNPKLQLERFMITDYLEKEESKKYNNEIQCVLRSLNDQVSIKEIGLSVWSSSWLLSILPHLKPGVLESIWLKVLGNEADWSGDSNGMDKVALLEQWKQAKQLYLWNGFVKFPMKYATHFKRFLICGNVISINMIDRIKDFLSKLEDFEYCRITHLRRNNIEYYQNRTGVPVPPNMSHYSIPDSDSCLEFSFASDDITIVRKKCRLH